MIKIEWAQWTLYFFLYAFAGWVWESAYVSVLSQQWVNRGFLHGPFIPIYGFGALLILMMTYSVRHHAAAVFFVGMIGATILEYGTGIVLDRLFHIRLWDYSLAVWNFQGYISVISSIFWGGFGCGTGYMDPSVFFFHHTDMACMGFGYCVPTAFDSGRSGLDFIDLGEHCEPE